MGRPPSLNFYGKLRRVAPIPLSLPQLLSKKLTYLLQFAGKPEKAENMGRYYK
jgi:hypothetical protein